MSIRQCDMCKEATSESEGGITAILTPYAYDLCSECVIVIQDVIRNYVGVDGRTVELT